MPRCPRLCSYSLIFTTRTIIQWAATIRLLLALLNNTGSLHPRLLQPVSHYGLGLSVHSLLHFCQSYGGNSCTGSRHHPRQPRHLNLLPTSLAHCTAGVHFYRSPTESDAAGSNIQKAAARFKSDLGTRFDNRFLPGLDVQLCAGVTEPGDARFQLQAASYAEAVVFAGLFAFFAVDGLVTAAFYVAKAVVLNGQVTVIFDDFGAVIFREQVQVFLGVDVDLLFVCLIFKPQFVAALTFMGLGFQGGAGFVFRQRVRRCVGSVIGSAGDDGLVRVAVEEGDNHFVADSGQGHEAILAASPALADS